MFICFEICIDMCIRFTWLELVLKLPGGESLVLIRGIEAALERCSLLFVCVLCFFLLCMCRFGFINDHPVSLVFLSYSIFWNTSILNLNRTILTQNNVGLKILFLSQVLTYIAWSSILSSSI